MRNIGELGVSVLEGRAGWLSASVLKIYTDPRAYTVTPLGDAAKAFPAPAPFWEMCRSICATNSSQIQSHSTMVATPHQSLLFKFSKLFGTQTGFLLHLSIILTVPRPLSGSSFAENLLEALQPVESGDDTANVNDTEVTEPALIKQIRREIASLDSDPSDENLFRERKIAFTRDFLMEECGLRLQNAWDDDVDTSDWSWEELAKRLKRENFLQLEPSGGNKEKSKSTSKVF